MNNFNFGYNCRNNFDNCFSLPVIDELETFSYICKHQSIFDTSLKDHLLEGQINKDFDNKISQLDRNSHFSMHVKIHSK